MAVAKTGSVRRHLGGKRAGRTRRSRENAALCRAAFGKIPGDDEIKTTVVNNPPRDINDPPPYVQHNYTHICKDCLASMPFTEKYQHKCKRTKPMPQKTVVAGQKPDKKRKRTPQFQLGDTVLLRIKDEKPYEIDDIGGKKVKRYISSDQIIGTIVDTKKLDQTFYRIRVGSLSWWHPADKLMLIAHAVPATPPGNNDDKPKPKCKIIKLPKQCDRLRTRPYTRHPSLIRQSCRTRSLVGAHRDAPFINRKHHTCHHSQTG